MKQRGAYVIHDSGGWGNQQLTKDCGIIPYLLYTDWQLKNRAVEDLNRQIQILLQDLNNL